MLHVVAHIALTRISTSLRTSLSAALRIEDRSVVETERARVAREIENLSRAVAVGRDEDGNEIPALVAMLKERDKRLKVLDSRLAPRDTPDRQALETALLQRVADWRGILRSNPKQGRVVLQQLVGEISLHSTADRPHWLATPRPAGLLVGLVLNNLTTR